MGTPLRDLTALDYLTAREAAAYLGFCTRELRRLVFNRQLVEGTHYFRLPTNGVRFKKSALAAWVEGSRPTPLPPTRGRHGRKVNLSAVP